MATSMPSLPPKFKPLQHYLKTAAEHDQRDPVVAYFCRMYAIQLGMKIDRNDKDCVKYLSALMDILEKTKRGLQGNEALHNEVVGQAHVENYAYKMFLYADNEDRSGRFSKNVVKSFYTAGMLFDVLTQFGEISPEVELQRKYAKFKAAYIHNCLKNGETPHPGPFGDEFAGMEAGGGSNEQPNEPLQPEAPAPQVPATSGGSSFHAYEDSSTFQEGAAATNARTGGHLTPQENAQCQKFCKYAMSSLTYDDYSTAVDYLEKALTMLKTKT